MLDSVTRIVGVSGVPLIPLPCTLGGGLGCLNTLGNKLSVSHKMAT